MKHLLYAAVALAAVAAPMTARRSPWSQRHPSAPRASLRMNRAVSALAFRFDRYYTKCKRHIRLAAGVPIQRMDVKFEDALLRRLEADATYTGEFDAAIVKAFRKRMQLIRAAADERAFYAMKSLHYEKLKGDREGQHSMRLNDQWRLILRVDQDESGKLVVIISIIDYH